MQETLHKSWKEKVIKKTMDKFDPLKLKTCLWQKIINKTKKKKTVLQITDLVNDLISFC